MLPEKWRPRIWSGDMTEDHRVGLAPSFSNFQLMACAKAFLVTSHLLIIFCLTDCTFLKTVLSFGSQAITFSWFSCYLRVFLISLQDSFLWTPSSFDVSQNSALGFLSSYILFLSDFTHFMLSRLEHQFHVGWRFLFLPDAFPAPSRVPIVLWVFMKYSTKERIATHRENLNVTLRKPGHLESSLM